MYAEIHSVSVDNPKSAGKTMRVWADDGDFQTGLHYEYSSNGFEPPLKQLEITAKVNYDHNEDGFPPYEVNRTLRIWLTPKDLELITRAAMKHELLSGTIAKRVSESLL
jgi:hypothetical protein